MPDGVSIIMHNLRREVVPIVSGVNVRVARASTTTVRILAYAMVGRIQRIAKVIDKSESHVHAATTDTDAAVVLVNFSAIGFSS